MRFAKFAAVILSSTHDQISLLAYQPKCGNSVGKAAIALQEDLDVSRHWGGHAVASQAAHL
jgi:hypothetical protein